MNAIKKAISSNKEDREDRRLSEGKVAGSRTADEGSIASRRSTGMNSAAAPAASTGYDTERVAGSPTQAGFSTDGAVPRNSATIPRGRPSGDFQRPHSMGHDASTNITSAFDPKSASHRHTHLAHKTHETLHEHETEEVQRLRTHERHVTHVQHHVQPIQDEEHLPEVASERHIPQTHIDERHVSSAEDQKAFESLNVHKDSQQSAPKQRTVVDLGEKVTEVVHHHVHNIVQPIVVKNTHNYHRIHTVIPSHHVTHEAPIVHQSIEHPVISKAAFLKQGGDLGSSVSHSNVDALFTGECTRQVNGVAEQLERELKLKPTNFSAGHDGHDHEAGEVAANEGLSTNAAAHAGGPSRV